MSATCQGCGTALPPNKASGARRKWCSERCRKQTLYAGTCMDCGTTLNGSNGRGPRASQRCRLCSIALAQAVRMHQSHKRRLTIQALWAEGLTLRQIAAQLNTSVNSIGSVMVKMRAAGWDLPYRYDIADVARETRRRERAA